MVKIGNKSVSISQVRYFRFRENFKTSQRALSELPEAIDQEGWMDFVIGSQISVTDKLVWKELENYLTKFLRANSKSNKESIFWEVKKTCIKKSLK